MATATASPSTTLGDVLRLYEGHLKEHFALDAVHRGGFADSTGYHAQYDITTVLDEPTVNSGTVFREYRLETVLWGPNPDQVLHRLELANTFYTGSTDSGTAGRVTEMAALYAVVFECVELTPGPLEPVDSLFSASFVTRLQIQYNTTS